MTHARLGVYLLAVFFAGCGGGSASVPTDVAIRTLSVRSEDIELQLSQLTSNRVCVISADCAIYYVKTLSDICDPYRYYSYTVATVDKAKLESLLAQQYDIYNTYMNELTSRPGTVACPAITAPQSVARCLENQCVPLATKP